MTGQAYTLRNGARFQKFATAVQLKNVGRKWWLYYGKGRQTGPFKSRKRAIEFYFNGGR